MQDSILNLSQDQQGCLLELMNVAMSQAGDSLAQLLDSFVNFNILQIELLDCEELSARLQQLVGRQKKVAVFMRNFVSQVSDHEDRGKASVIFEEAAAQELVELWMDENPADEDAKNEILKDVAYLISSACLTGFGEQLDIDIDIDCSATHSLGNNVGVEKIVREQQRWPHTFLIHVSVKIDTGELQCFLLLQMHEEALLIVVDHINAILNETFILT